MRKTFFAACPLCAAEAFRPVVAFDELAFVRCAACGVVYKREQTPELSARVYEEDYFRHNRAGYLRRFEHRVRKCRRQLLACLELAPEARDVLDIGCSAGYVLEAARRLGLAPVGLDNSRFAVELCRTRGYAAELGSLTDIPLPDASFDVVTLKHTLEHVDEPLTALREVHRVLRPGGLAFVIVPDAAYYKLSLMPRRGRSFRPDRRGWQHHVYFYEENLAQACTQAGLVPVKAGKSILRRRLARGPRALWEYVRYGWLLAWTWGCRVTRFRRELQLIARRPFGSKAHKVSTG